MGKMSFLYSLPPLHLMIFPIRLGVGDNGKISTSCYSVGGEDGERAMGFLMREGNNEEIF